MIKTMTIMAIFLLFPSVCPAFSGETVDNQAHGLLGCSSAMLVRDGAKAFGVEHYDVTGFIGALAVAKYVNNAQDESPNFEDIRTTMLGAVVCLGASELLVVVGRSTVGLRINF